MAISSYGRRCVAEAAGTAMLLAVVVGSGIMAERLAGGNVALALLANALATGAGLSALILAFGPVSGAHFNPLVTLSAAWDREFPAQEIGGYLAAQFAGASLGVVVAHSMFGEPALTLSKHARPGAAVAFSEFVAAFGLLAVIKGSARQGAAPQALAVGAYIAAGYWFTASTSFANPAVTLARAFTDTFTGIRLADVPGFVVAQVLGAAAATLLLRWLLARRPSP
jgi:glycerol uptake facilitator-like aquaporin